MMKKSAKSIGIGCVVAMMATVTGCVADAPQDAPAPSPSPAVTKPAVSASIETSGTCAAADVALAGELRAHVAQTSSFVGIGSVLFRDVLVESMVGTALDPIGLGSASDGFDHTFDAKTGEYVITAKKDLTVGSARLGDWDPSAVAELRFRLYWGEEHARAGQVLAADAFVSDSYLVDPSLKVEILEARVSVGYESAGPLVSIFGWGETPKNPAVVRVSDADRVQSNVRGLMADARIIIRAGDESGVSTTIELATAKKSLGDWITSPDPDLRVVAGITKGNGSTITVTEWTQGTGEGHVRFAGSAGAKGELSLRQNAVASAKLACR